MWGGLHWESATENGPYAAPSKLSCTSYVATTSQLTVAAFDCDGFFVASNDLSRALVAGAAGADMPSSYGKIVASGTYTDGGVWWDVCVDSESDSGPGPKGGWVDGVAFSPSSGASTKEPERSSWKKCGGSPPAAAPPAAPRWQGGIR